MSAAHRPKRRSRTRPPSRHAERDLIDSGHELVAGVDEVGRGALAGPVSVGVVVVRRDTGRIPAGLRDSKLLRPQVRQSLCAPIRRWAYASSVGHASPAEIDAWGIIGALRIAGQRALTVLAEQGAAPSAVILDGHHDWLTPPRGMVVEVPAPQVTTRIKADLTCASVAAASVLAKCERDDAMTVLHPDHPEFGWAENKGYAAPEHVRALRERGPTPWHRRSWALPGTTVALEQGMMDL
ncbi:ribonuclease HII [Pseudactinotalea sp. Z1748]|uniref:ribonuclease HII n=1 Tax=Pseudactinotalea sp. Z1748 TaxID=3413027 RepID=UPI003C7AD66A